MDTRTTAARFRTLHQGPEPLLLPNAWDAGSARVIEASGAQAIATTSAGLAWARGYADGYALPVRYLVATVTEIARVIRVPLTVDMEAGYADDLAAIAENAQALAERGRRRNQPRGRSEPAGGPLRAHRRHQAWRGPRRRGPVRQRSL